MNIQRLREVRALILAKPKRFDMDDFGRAESCGTTLCIGGHAAFRAGFIRNPRRNEDAPDDVIATRKGREANDSNPWNGEYCWPPMYRVSLDLNVRQSERLFSVPEWPAAFRDAYNSADTASERAIVAAKRISHFIKTKGKQ